MVSNFVTASPGYYHSKTKIRSDFFQADDIPIDIHIPKLLEWLLSRRHCKVGWQAHITSVREKINSALEDMPEHQGIVDLLSGSCQ